MMHNRTPPTLQRNGTTDHLCIVYPIDLSQCNNISLAWETGSIYKAKKNKVDENPYGLNQRTVPCKLFSVEVKAVPFVSKWHKTV
mmetsp:Transcript_17655/g.36633  ORF Transcript_17655/g.36633 Transcript_17655/m.36633 type:complete len:85 (+) Transcript_17655:4100-4354(+)